MREIKFWIEMIRAGCESKEPGCLQAMIFAYIERTININSLKIYSSYALVSIVKLGGLESESAFL